MSTYIPLLTLLDVPDENSGVQKANQEQFNIDQLRNWGVLVDDQISEQLQSTIDRINNLLTGVETASEVVDARDDVYGQIFTVLKDRLDFMQNPFVSQLTEVKIIPGSVPFPNITAFRYNYGAGIAQTGTITLDNVEQIDVRISLDTSTSMSIEVIKPYLIASPTISYSDDGKSIFLIDSTNNECIAFYINNDCQFTQ